MCPSVRNLCPLSVRPLPMIFRARRLLTLRTYSLNTRQGLRNIASGTVDLNSLSISIVNPEGEERVLALSATSQDQGVRVALVPDDRTAGPALELGAVLGGILYARQNPARVERLRRGERRRVDPRARRSGHQPDEFKETEVAQVADLRISALYAAISLPLPKSHLGSGQVFSFFQIFLLFLFHSLFRKLNFFFFFCFFR